MTTDEMAARTLTIIPARDEELADLRQVRKNHKFDLFIDRAQEDKRQWERVATMMATFGKNTNGRIDPEKRPPLRAFLEASGMLKGLGDGF